MEFLRRLAEAGEGGGDGGGDGGGGEVAPAGAGVVVAVLLRAAWAQGMREVEDALAGVVANAAAEEDRGEKIRLVEVRCDVPDVFGVVDAGGGSGAADAVEELQEALAAVRVRQVQATSEDGVALLRELGVANVPEVVLVQPDSSHTVLGQGRPAAAEEDDEWAAVRTALQEQRAPASNFETEADNAAAAGNAAAEGLQLYEALNLQGAAHCFAHSLRLGPRHRGRLFNMAAVMQTASMARFAVPFVAAVLELDAEDVTAHKLLGSVLYESEPDLVVDTYRALVAHNPQNLRAVHQLAVLTGTGASAEQADPSYVARVYDEMADTFEEKLVDHLDYRVPWTMLEDITEELTTGGDIATFKAGSAILDLGCGTGLVGRLFRPCFTAPESAQAKAQAKDSEGEGEGEGEGDSNSTGAGEVEGGSNGASAADPATGTGCMLGVDVSSRMVEKCRAGGWYDQLFVGDVHEVLENEVDFASLGGACPNDATVVDMILAADTFIYVGKLDRIFGIAKRRLRNAGIFSFSVEIEPGCDKFRLAQTGRFVHDPGYIDGLIEEHGFQKAFQRDIKVRNESNAPVPGLLYLLRRRRQAAESTGVEGDGDAGAPTPASAAKSNASVESATEADTEAAAGSESKAGAAGPAEPAAAAAAAGAAATAAATAADAARAAEQKTDK